RRYRNPRSRSKTPRGESKLQIGERRNPYPDFTSAYRWAMFEIVGLGGVLAFCTASISPRRRREAIGATEGRTSLLAMTNLRTHTTLLASHFSSAFSGLFRSHVVLH